MSEQRDDTTKKSRRGVRRRDVVKGVVATSIAGGAALAAQPPPAPAAGPITAADVAAADRLTGRSYSEAERELMAKRAPRVRDRLKAIRAATRADFPPPAIHFDPRLPGARYPTGASSCVVSRGATPRVPADLEQLAFATVVELGRLLNARKVTSTALTRMYLERLKRYGPKLLCVVTLTEERALEQAARADREIAAGNYRGPLHGIPWGAKDLLATKGIRTTWGARPYEQQVFDEDATVVKRLEAAGAVLLAKLSMGELALGDVWYGGTTKNPWRPKQGSSGSSAGSGSATAAGLAGFAIGTETLGSIVSPSVVNGVTGLRPTFGRVSRQGAMALAWSLDKIGPMCRGVEDCAVVFSAIHGPDGHDATVTDVPFRWNPRAALAGLRVGLDAAAFQEAGKEPERKAIYDAALETLRRLGVQPKPVTLPKRTPAYDALPLTIDVEGAASFQQLVESGRASMLERQGEGAWPNTFRVGSTVPAADYIQLMRVRTQLQREMAEVFRDVDLYLNVPFAGSTMLYTNFTGHPSLITRCGMRDGLPQSLEFVGDLYKEAEILRLALAFEQATEWHRQWPELEQTLGEGK